MAYFKLDIYQANNVINDFRKNKKKYVDDFEIMHGTLNNVDSCWSDLNCPIFQKKIADDKSKISEFFSSIDLLCNKIENFNDELIKIVSSFGFSNKECVIKFDNEQVSACKSRLSSTVSYLNNAIYIINRYLLCSNYSNKSHLYTLRSQLYNAINITNTIKSNFEKYVSSVSSLLNKYNSQINDIDGFDFKIDKIEYQPNIVDLK